MAAPMGNGGKGPTWATAARDRVRLVSNQLRVW